MRKFFSIMMAIFLVFGVSTSAAFAHGDHDDGHKSGYDDKKDEKYNKGDKDKDKDKDKYKDKDKKGNKDKHKHKNKDKKNKFIDYKKYIWAKHYYYKHGKKHVYWHKHFYDKKQKKYVHL